jgi:hypothetical protein
MTGNDLTLQMNQIGNAGTVLVQTPSGVFAVSAAQKDENGAIVLRAMDTPVTAAALADYDAMRAGEEPATPETPATTD